MPALTSGRHQVRLSRIGLGGIPIGGLHGHTNSYDVVRTIEAAIEGGITWCDTSPAYGAGEAETALGKVLHHQRRDVAVATKIGSGIDSTGQFWCLNNRPNILRQVEGSLRRLQREMIDIYAIPGEDYSTPIGETVGALEELRSRGKIRFIGYCTTSIERLREAMKHGTIDVVQAPYNIFNRTIESTLIPFCRATNIPIVASEPYCRGLLAGHLHKHSSFTAGDHRLEDRRFRGEQYRQNIENVNRLRAVADQHGLSLLQLALGWILQNPKIAGVMCGARSALQIRQSILAGETSLTPETILAIDQVVGTEVRQQAE
jgi:aryl-alcohol dehydrogenase-like predicted oxidoreductase